MPETVSVIPENISFAVLLTAAGTPVAAAIITGVVALLKAVIPALFAYVNGAQVAFVLSAILYLLAGISIGVDSLDAGLVVVVAWVGCATASVGVSQVTKGALTNKPPAT